MRARATTKTRRPTRMDFSQFTGEGAGANMRPKVYGYMSPWHVNPDKTAKWTKSRRKDWDPSMSVPLAECVEPWNRIPLTMFCELMALMGVDDVEDQAPAV